MKLLTVTHFFESHRGGIEIVAGRLARELARRGNEVTWIATDASPAPSDREAGLRTISLAAVNVTERWIGVPYPFPSLSSFRRLIDEVKAADAVLVHDGLYLTSVAAFVAARLHGKPVIVVQHVGAVPYGNPVLRTLMHFANRLVVRPLLARADQTVFISEVTARYFAGARFRVPPQLIFNGVDTGIFFPPSGPEEIVAARGRHGLPGDRPIALFVGRFVEKKGLPVLERLARARPDVTFAFAGWGGQDPRQWTLPNVRVLDGLAGAALAALYRASDIFVLPSSGEGFPLVIQEALACGLPVICGAETAGADPAAAAYLTGVPILLDDPDRTAAMFGQALESRLSEDVHSLRRSARFDLARGRYSWSGAAARYVEILARLSDAQADSAAPGLGSQPRVPMQDIP